MKMEENAKGNQQLTLLEDGHISTYRPIHYLGSKLRVIENISEVINSIDPTFGRVYDLFSGSGTVSSFLGQSRPVTAVDIQEYSRILTSAVLHPFNEEELDDIKTKVGNMEVANLNYCIEPIINYEENAIKSSENGEIYDICELVEYGALMPFMNNERQSISKELRSAMNETVNRLRTEKLIESVDSITTRYFGGTYFSYRQAVELDELLEIANTFDGRLKDIFMAAILSAASEAVNTVGKQFAQPLKAIDSKGNAKKSLVSKIKKDRSINVRREFFLKLEDYYRLSKGNFSHKALRSNFAEALDGISSDTTIVYADPPYTRYHYSRYYHVLETMSLRDNPEITKIKSNGSLMMTRGIYRTERHQSPFSIKSLAKEAFTTLFRTISEKNVSLILSYSPYDSEKDSTPRVQTISELIELANIYFKDVELVAIEGIVHSKLNASSKNFEIPKDAEILLICKESKISNMEE